MLKNIFFLFSGLMFGINALLATPVPPPPHSNVISIPMNEQAKKQCMNCPVANFSPTTLTTLSGNLTGQFRISANITLSGNTTITDAEILLEPNVRITVPNGMILRIYHSQLFGCNYLWEGIVVQNGGSLLINNNSMIEDAKIAVSLLFPIGTTTTTSVLNIKNSIFNKNKYGKYYNSRYSR